MATARDLERYLVSNGFSAIRLDTCNRLLREHDRIPSAGRGLYAPQIGAAEGAVILLTYLGCTKAVRALERLNKLEITRDDTGRSLFVAVRTLLECPYEIRELRVSRLRSRARLILLNGKEITFSRPNARSAEGRLEAEGVADGLLLRNIAALLVGNTPAASQPDEPEDAE